MGRRALKLHSGHDYRRHTGQRWIPAEAWLGALFAALFCLVLALTPALRRPVWGQGVDVWGAHRSIDQIVFDEIRGFRALAR